jgi:hypothetical protein
LHVLKGAFIPEFYHHAHNFSVKLN